MLIQDGLGKTINMSVEDYLNADDEDWQAIIASGRGQHIEDAFYGRYADHRKTPIEELDPDFSDLAEEIALLEELDNTLPDGLEDEDFIEYFNLDDI